MAVGAGQRLGSSAAGAVSIGLFHQPFAAVGKPVVTAPEDLFVGSYL